MQFDVIEKTDKAVFQHGKENDRLYLMKWDGRDPELLLTKMNTIITQNGYSKAFIKVREENASFFAEDEFIEEARIPGYYGTGDCVFMGKFYDPQRASLSVKEREAMVKTLSTALEKQKGQKKDEAVLPGGFSLRPLLNSDIPELCSLYKDVFKTYPFPIHDEEYIADTMQNSVQYFGVFYKGKLAGASSAEIDAETSSAELTDFAVNPEYRGNKLGSVLLDSMEEALKERGIQTPYTIARAMSAGMNCTFSKAGYSYAGTLVNNTNISGSIESMNVWYKK